MHTHTHTHTHTVLFIIYWCDVKLTAVILGVCLVVLLTLTLNTFIHTVVLVLLSFMVVSLTYIVTKISIDSFYNKEIRNPFQLVPPFLILLLQHANFSICLFVRPHLSSVHKFTSCVTM